MGKQQLKKEKGRRLEGPASFAIKESYKRTVYEKTS